MNVLFVTADMGGCRLYRCSLPGLELHNAGHTVLVCGDMAVDKTTGEIYAAENGSYTKEIHFEVVVLQRFMRSDAPEIIRRARASGQVVINDVDDWFDGLPQSNKAFFSTHPKLNGDRNREHYRRALQASSAVTVSTPYLAERIQASVGCPVVAIRNAPDPRRWPTTFPSDGPLVFGWVGAVGYRSPGDLTQLSGVVGPFMAQHPEARFVHIGASTPAETTEVAGVLGIQNPEQVESRPFCPIDDLPVQMWDVDVFLAPLENNPFSLAKSAIKAQEASASGSAFIASDMPEYRWFSDGRAGSLCGNPKEWRQALERMLDPEERLKSARAGRERLQEVSIQNTWRKWEKTYEECLRDR